MSSQAVLQQLSTEARTLRIPAIRRWYFSTLPHGQLVEVMVGTFEWPTALTGNYKWNLNIGTFLDRSKTPKLRIWAREPEGLLKRARIYEP